MKCQHNLMEQLHNTAGGQWKDATEGTKTKTLRKSVCCVPRTLLGSNTPITWAIVTSVMRMEPTR